MERVGAFAITLTTEANRLPASISSPASSSKKAYYSCSENHSPRTGLFRTGWVRCEPAKSCLQSLEHFPLGVGHVILRLTPRCAQPPCVSLRLIAEATAARPRCLSPPTSRGAYNRRSFAATGRGWRHPTFTCRWPAPGRRARWLEIQGPVPTGSGEAPAMVVEPRPAFSGSRPQRRLPAIGQSGGQADGQRMARVTRRRQRGGRKATRCGGRKPSIGCGVGLRATRRTPADPVGGAGGVGNSRKNARLTSNGKAP